MFFCSLIEELCTKEENYKTSCFFNFGHECIFKFIDFNKSFKDTFLFDVIQRPKLNFWTETDNIQSNLVIAPLLKPFKNDVLSGMAS